jgi:lipid II:glycine glycyltransferase (peptidoglycan interpeptide bridge formation enzyme)
MLDSITHIEEQPYTDHDAEWDRFVSSHRQGSLLQTTAWARLKNRFGWRSQRVWLRRDDRLVAGAQVLVRTAALGLIRVAYIPHGPIVDWQDEEQIDVILNQIDHAAYEQGAGFLKMEPLLWQQEFTADRWDRICERHGCLTDTDTIQPPRTAVVDLAGTEEEILARMKQKTRYNIRLSGRKGVVVREGSRKDIPIFNHLIQTTSRRNEFGVHTPEYYRAAYDLWGVPDHPEPELESQFLERNDDLWGVYRFKRGFGGEVRRTVGTADRVYNSLVYRIYRRRTRR